MVARCSTVSGRCELRKPDSDTVWAALGNELGGEIIPGKRGNVKQVRFPWDVWTIVLDTYTASRGNHSATYTRASTVFRSRDDFRFRVYRRTPFSGIGRMFGVQDLEIGMPDLDRDYVVQSNSPGRIQSLLFLRDVARPLETLRAGRLETRNLRRRGIRDPKLRELVYLIPGVIREGDRLRMMVQLMGAVMDHLVRIGAAVHEPISIEA